MKNVLLFSILLSVFACKKDNEVTRTSQPTNTTHTFQQDNQLLGTWSLDSATIDGVTTINSTGYGSCVDSIRFRLASFNGLDPIPDFDGIYGSVGTQSCFWDTSDSLYFKVGNHDAEPMEAAKYWVNADRMVLNYRIFQNSFPVHTSVVLYYHR